MRKNYGRSVAVGYVTVTGYKSWGGTGTVCVCVCVCVGVSVVSLHVLYVCVDVCVHVCVCVCVALRMLACMQWIDDLVFCPRAECLMSKPCACLENKTTCNFGQ